MVSLPRYENYKDSGIEWLGAIPENWEILRNFSVFQERKEVNKPDMELLSVTIEKGIIKQSEITTKKDSSNEDQYFGHKKRGTKKLFIG
jgi:type I restriction enzyme S subunit